MPDINDIIFQMLMLEAEHEIAMSVRDIVEGSEE